MWALLTTEVVGRVGCGARVDGARKDVRQADDEEGRQQRGREERHRLAGAGMQNWRHG